jgi:stearoyl-CoA desaturase (delta-9 desaturase)
VETGLAEPAGAGPSRALGVGSHPEVATLEPPVLERLGTPKLSRADLAASAPFLTVHAAALVGALLVPPSWPAIGLCLAVYYARILAITLAYHRYFAHRTFKTSRAFQLVLAVWAMTSAQRGVLWWAGHHRNHHRFSDQPDDIHSPARSGFFWSHVGWILSERNDRAPLEAIRDMARFPELAFLERHQYLPATVLGVALYWFGGWSGLVWGFLVSTVLLWHGTFTINSLSHVYGRRRFPTTDTSRNNPWLVLVTLGEGWHNNHHFFCSSARLGFRWWEVDIAYWAICALEKLGLVWDVRRPPASVLAGSRDPLALPEA